MDSGEAIEVDTAAPFEGDSTSPEARDYEAEARAMGWTPKDEFKGDEKRWIDAETFVKRGEEVLPLLKAQNKKFKQELDDLKRQMKRASEYFSRAEERGYQQALADIERRHAEAVELGDKAAADKAARDMVKLEKEFDRSAPEPTATPEQIAAEFQAWVESNDWYATDETKTRYADLQASLMGPAENWPQGRAAWFAEIERRVSTKFAERKPPVNAAPGARVPAKNGKTYADLPPEAKAMCDKWVKNGIIKSRDDYVKSYDWS